MPHCCTHAPNHASGHRQPTPPSETPGHSRASPGQSSGGSMVGLMAIASKRAYAIPQSAAPRAPAPAAGHCWPISLQETLKHSSVSASVGSLGPGVHKVCLSPLSTSGGYGVWVCMWFCPSYHLAGASPLPLDVWYLFLVGSNIFLSIAIQQQVAILKFYQEMSTCPSAPPFYSAWNTWKR